MNLIVIAKAPRAGVSKTRLCPPCTPAQAAALAEAALRDTLHAVLATPADRRVVVLDGTPGPWLPDGFEVLPQRGDGLDERLAAAFADVGGPAFLVGMDTPQLTPPDLEHGMDATARHGAAIGGAPDGGYWAIGLRDPDPRVFAGVPMSAADTGARQRAQLSALGLPYAELPALRDVDHFDDAVAVAHEAPDTRFAAAVRSLVAAGAVAS
ncbi:TIGR04282 family arsenosugar biosynthesis glycosyltransferase [Paraconexibacter algicola]|uniref:TIGR04282 family arsenosugar biosynthesis glycosyltransferase n=1 Tax=Paraconexibacter algicola TaxID=2133960 RepID=UPI0018EEA78A|nr:TIGR04282 family arsenosugar biosynthesis glycosyltransferase [Paraconexibacter algicola]